MTKARLGHVKGEPVRFINGHQNRHYLVPPVAEDRGYSTLCLIWQRSHNENGYALIDGRSAVRVLWEREFGRILEGHDPDHLCRVRNCVNLEHIEIVTHRENVRRSARTKLTTDAVGVIRSSNEPLAVLAERFGVSYSLVSRVRRGVSWVI